MAQGSRTFVVRPIKQTSPRPVHLAVSRSDDTAADSNRLEQWRLGIAGSALGTFSAQRASGPGLGLFSHAAQQEQEQEQDEETEKSKEWREDARPGPLLRTVSATPRTSRFARRLLSLPASADSSKFRSGLAGLGVRFDVRPVRGS